MIYKKAKIILTTVLSMWILTIGMTRIYFNVHYPSDVACGIIIGMICGYVSVKYLNYALPLLNELVQYYYPDCVLFQI